MSSALTRTSGAAAHTKLPIKFKTFLPGRSATRGYLLLSPITLFLLFTVITPLAIVLTISFWTQNYLDFDRTFTFDNYRYIFDRPVILGVLIRSIAVSAIVTVLVIVISFPTAYYIAFSVKRNKMIWLVLITLPFWTSYLFRIFAWKLILGYNGIINSGLMTMGLIEQPLEFMLYNVNAIVITLTHAWAAFAILPIYVSLEKIDKTLLEAAADLGEGPVMTFLRVTLPLSLPGVIAAALFVFIPTVGDYVTPKLVGGTTGMIGPVIETMFGRSMNWPVGAALSTTSLLSICAIVVLGVWLASMARGGIRDTTR